MKHQQWLETHKELFDEEKIGVVANARALPNRSWGLCLLCLKNEFLNVYNTIFSQEVGELLYSIDFRKISEVKYSGFILNPYLEFKYERFFYKFVDFGMAKAFLKALIEHTKQ